MRKRPYGKEMPATQQILIDLNISAAEWLRIYRGEAYNVSTLARDGRRVHFPARILQRFVAHEGVRGSFAIAFDEKGKFQQISRLD